MDRAAAFASYTLTCSVDPFQNPVQFFREFEAANPEPKPFDFIGQAICTKSDKFFGEKVSYIDFMRIIGDCIVALNQLDAVKKALFYGREFPATPGHFETCEKLPHGWRHFNEHDGVSYAYTDESAIDIMHAFIGKATEAGEGLELLNNTLRNEGTFDPINAKEETFDGQWYDAILCNAIGISFEDGQRNNIAKLRKRYGDKFSAYDAMNRDLTAERATLESVPDNPHRGPAAPAIPAGADSAEVAPSRTRQFIGKQYIGPYPVNCGDADFLRTLAVSMSYNNSESEAVTKHRLHEIAMKLERLDKV